MDGNNLRQHDDMSEKKESPLELPSYATILSKLLSKSGNCHLLQAAILTPNDDDSSIFGSGESDLSGITDDKEFDTYFFSNLDHRADLLQPFYETKILGLWDVHCTVKGGGISSQAGAICLGVSRALQNWELGLRPPLRAARFLTRDPRVVERKKPGTVKGWKSFQWVKR